MFNNQYQPVMGTIIPLAPDELVERICDAFRVALNEAKPQEDAEPTPEWGSRHDASVIIGVSLPTIHALISQGLIEARKVGRRTLINLADLRAKIASGEFSKYKHSK